MRCQDVDVGRCPDVSVQNARDHSDDQVLRPGTIASSSVGAWLRAPPVVDASTGEIVAADLTGRRTRDAARVPALLGRINESGGVSSLLMVPTMHWASTGRLVRRVKDKP